MKKKIKEVIVVEGIHDLEKISKYVDADIITSNGKGFDDSFLQLCKQLNETKGIIVFTDPDGPGEYIRRKIIEVVGTCKHASLHIIQSKKKGRVGIEHASKEDIIEALEKVATYDIMQQSLKWNEFVDLGLTGNPQAQLRRDLLSAYYHFPKSNAKTNFKYLNMMGISKAMILEVLHENNC